ncbi:MAG: hypothetical protein KJ941_02250 [Bacteroidetes bacterium]|nr:hypothetical protein [Bacteroidota bacterium]
MIECSLATVKKQKGNTYVLTLNNVRPTKSRIIELIEAIKQEGEAFNLNLIIDISRLSTFNIQEKVLIDFYLQKYCINIAVYAPNSMLYMISKMYVSLSKARCNFKCFKQLDEAMVWLRFGELIDD